MQKSLNRKETKTSNNSNMQENKKSENCLKFTWFKTIFSSKYKDKRHKTITSGKVSHLFLTETQSQFRSNGGY